MASTPPAVAPLAAATTRPSNHNNRHLHHEDLLLRTWRSIAHSVAIVTGKAEKLASVDLSSSVTTDHVHKELNEATMGFLRSHVEWGRSISYLEAKLEGRAAEMEGLQHYVRTHPCLKRKRKRRNDGENPLNHSYETKPTLESSLSATSEPPLV